MTTTMTKNTTTAAAATAAAATTTTTTTLLLHCTTRAISQHQRQSRQDNMTNDRFLAVTTVSVPLQGATLSIIITRIQIVIHLFKILPK